MTAKKPAAVKKAAKRAPRKKAEPAAEIPVVPGVTPLSQLLGRKPSAPDIEVPEDLAELAGDALEPVATFAAYGPRVATNDNGELSIALKADKLQKYNAMPITDHVDEMLYIKVFVARRGGA